jgi:spermidine synthase
VLSIPFFFSGILIATVFLLHSAKSKFIYSSDLLGAGTGSLTVLVLLNIAGPEYAILAASTLCFIGAVIVGRKTIKIVTLILIIINLLVFYVHPDFIRVKISPYKRLSLFLKYPGAEHLGTYHGSYSRIDTFKSPAVRFAPGLSLRYLDPLPEQIGVAADGNQIDAVTDAGNKSKLRFLKFLPSSIAYEIGRNNNVLVLDAKGGLHVLLARYNNTKEIYKVESNPMVIKVIRDYLNEFSGRIFDDNTWTGYGRNFLQSSRSSSNDIKFYDVIDLSMTSASVSGMFGISEDYRYTVEAFEKYLSSLTKDGLLSVNFYLIPPPRTEFRILATILKALEQMDIKDVSERFAAIRSWDSMTILVKNSSFTQQEIQHIKRFSEDRRFDLVYYPGIKEEESNRYIRMPSNEYFNGFYNLLNAERRAFFLNNYLFDINPVYDDNPFFHYYLKLKNIKAIYKVMGQKWLYFLEEGYLLPIIFIIISVLSIVLILFPVFSYSFHKKPIMRDSGKRFERLEPSIMLPALLYFAMLGLGFMFVEVAFIQKSILLFENPSYSVAVVLTSLLISSGMGSMLSSKFSKLGTPYSLLILAFLILIYNLIHPYLLNTMSAFSLDLRILLMSVILMPLGLFMGIPFPTGLRLLGQKNEALIPWAWAINACVSVLAPILTIMLAILTGFKIVIFIGMLTYLTAFFALRKLIKL